MKSHRSFPSDLTNHINLHRKLSMKQVTRRAVLVHGALATTNLLGCGGGDDGRGLLTEPAADTAKPPSETSPGTTAAAAPAASSAATNVPVSKVPTRAVTTLTPLPSGTAHYRNAHTFLFQGTSWDVQRARVAGGSDRRSGFGPNADYVDAACGWPWERKGGDWIDRNGVRHGSTAWASVQTLSGPESLIKSYAIDVTAVVIKIFDDQRWCAFRVAASGAHRNVAGLWHGTDAPPNLLVNYQDGTSAQLRCAVTAAAITGIPNQIQAEIPLPMFVEFERPTKPVRSAEMQITVTRHPGSIAASIGLFLLDPPVNQDPVRQGVAATVAALDSGIETASGVIGAHRYTDASSLSDFVYDGPRLNTLARREFDPAIWGGAHDFKKLPHLGLGKFHLNSGFADFVTSHHHGDGFEPLAPTLGALRLQMPVLAHADGAVVGYGGTGGANANIFMPEPLLGRLPRLFVRHYFRLGDPDGNGYLRDPSRRYQVYHNEGQIAPAWTDWAGKFGIMPDHTTTYGGTSGSAGGGRGWQMRLGWTDCDANYGGPCEGGISPSFHLFDFGVINPPGYNYSADNGAKVCLGQRGGLGGMFYVNQWYCIETELKLNTVMDEDPGYAADGELRAWIDGRLVFERTGMVFRAKPLFQAPEDPSRMGPVRDLGIKSLWLNWYHGGTTQNSVPRTSFISGLVWGTEYIGPMRS
jgi:hypothetical protein